jgi:hypothetical protein
MSNTQKDIYMINMNVYNIPIIKLKFENENAHGTAGIKVNAELSISNF